VELEGVLIAARDQAHKRLLALIREGLPLPFDPRGAAIYYTGPSPAPAGRAVGAAGPTTSGRMDSMTRPLLERGVKVLVGKGRRSPEVKAALRAHGAVYLAAAGGAGAFLSQRIIGSELLAFPELGPEAVLKLTVRAFPAVVVNDAWGGDLYESGPEEYRAFLKKGAARP
jgi:fumarate hydratase subunit beta